MRPLAVDGTVRGRLRACVRVLAVAMLFLAMRAASTLLARLQSRHWWCDVHAEFSVILPPPPSPADAWDDECAGRVPY